MADEKKQPEPTIAGGIGETEFNTWKHHPVTKAYLQYLMDMRDDIKGAAVLAWESGKLSLAVADEMRGAANYLKRSAEPDFEEINRFYIDAAEAKKMETQADEPTTGKQSAQG